MATIRYNTAPAFRNTFFDLLGEPAIDGTLESFKATDHGTQKALYKSNIITPPATTPPAYSNPIDLDASGSIPEPGALFYASDENYYLVLKDKTGAEIATIDNWNAPENTDPTPKTDEVDLTKYILNDDFNFTLRKVFYSADLPAAIGWLLATPFWEFWRSNISATIKVSFDDFIVGQTDVPDNPKRYFHYECSSAGAGETYKNLTYLIRDVYAFAGETVTFSFYAKSVSNNILLLYYSQFYGTGGSAQLPDELVGTFQLTPNWTKYTATFVIRNITGKVITNDHGMSIKFGLPLNSLANIDIVKGKLDRGSVENQYNFEPRYYDNGNVVKALIPNFPYNRNLAAQDKSLTYNTQTNQLYWKNSDLIGSIRLWPTEIIPEGYLECNGQVVMKAWYWYLYQAIGFRYGADFGNVSAFVGNEVTVTAYVNGDVTDASAGTTPFTITIIQQGTAVLPEIFKITTTDAASITNESPYMTFTFKEIGSGTPADFALVILKNNSNVVPSLPGKTILIANIYDGYSAAQVAAEINTILSPIAFKVPDLRGYFLRFWDHGALRDPDAATRTARLDGFGGNNPGTTQLDEFKSHNHTYYSTTVDTIGAEGGYERLASQPLVNTSNTGGAETRGKNIYLTGIIKY